MHQQPECICCGITIHWQPTIVDGKIFCCLGCAQGGPCECDYDNLPQLHQITSMLLRELPDQGGEAA